MAVATAPIQPQYRSLHAGVMGMYIFLCSEVMFFGSLFAMYFYMVGSHTGWPPPGTKAVEVWPLPTINTVILLSSGVTCHFGLEALRQNGRLGRGGTLGAGLMGVALALMVLAGVLAVAGGAVGDSLIGFGGAVVAFVSILAFLGRGPFVGRRVFLGLWVCTILLGVFFEAGQAYEFATAHINFTTNQFASAFFTMTGFHGGHVAGGLVLLCLVLFRALKGQFSAANHVAPAAITLYWHFVDVVWIFLYLILYLAVTGPGASAA
ncbi:MAG: heme-copper oxidase subunit III [Chloroflexota bacterium]